MKPSNRHIHSLGSSFPFNRTAVCPKRCFQTLVETNERMEMIFMCLFVDLSRVVNNSSSRRPISRPKWCNLHVINGISSLYEPLREGRFRGCRVHAILNHLTKKEAESAQADLIPTSLCITIYQTLFLGRISGWSSVCRPDNDSDVGWSMDIRLTLVSEFKTSYFTI